MSPEFVKFAKHAIFPSLFAGIWGSAFTILLQRILREGETIENAISSVHNSGDLNEELRMYLLILRSLAILKGLRFAKNKSPHFVIQSVVKLKPPVTRHTYFFISGIYLLEVLITISSPRFTAARDFPYIFRKFQKILTISDLSDIGEDIDTLVRTWKIRHPSSGCGFV